MAPLGIAIHLPWVIPIFQALPQPAGIDQWIAFSDAQIKARKKVCFSNIKYTDSCLTLSSQYTPEKPDIMSWLIEAENEHAGPVVSDPRYFRHSLVDLKELTQSLGGSGVTPAS